MQKLIDVDAPRVFDEPARSGIAGLEQLADNLLAVPLRGDGSRLGILLAGTSSTARPSPASTRSSATRSPGTLAIFLRNTILFADTQSMFLGALRALTAAIDAKDSYTHGHSERVALLARMLAEAAGLDAATCERVFLSGLVHDVGKIGVPEAVLSKPGAADGRRVRADQEAPRDRRPHPAGHPADAGPDPRRAVSPRTVGRAGLSPRRRGADIPLFGRLIGLADAFDAMSSNRTYRSGMSRREVLSEVIRCRGSQFDPELADLFVRLDFTAFDRAIGHHTAASASTARRGSAEEQAA